MKENLMVIFGGKSVEHDISIITALQIMKCISKSYNIVPVYVQRDGVWCTAENLEDVDVFIDFEEKISFLAENNLDYKTTLQELVQKEHIRPSYIDLEKDDELFVRAVVIDDKIVATGSGKTKQEADKVAAKNAINILKGN